MTWKTVLAWLLLLAFGCFLTLFLLLVRAGAAPVLVCGGLTLAGFARLVYRLLTRS